MRNTRLYGLCLLLFILLVYASFPTRNHYWDGIGFALAIEDAKGLTSGLFNPNHLLYNFFGYLLYQSVHAVTGLRALCLLSVSSMLFSVGTAYVLFSMLMSLLRNTYYSVCLILLFAFSAMWWKFSTDANVYVPSVFFIVLVASELQKQNGPRWFAIGLTHAVSMLLHEIAVFFCPGVLVALFCNAALRSQRRALRSAVLYTATVSSIVVLSYLWVWFGVVKGSRTPLDQPGYAQVDTSGVGTARVNSFFSWIVSNGKEEFAFVSVGRNLQESLRSNVRLFFGGRFSLAFNYIETPLLVILGILLVCSLGLLMLTLREAFKLHPSRLLSEHSKPNRHANLVAFLVTWIGSFATFLFLWLTEYPYYRLFYLPALILLVGILIQRSRKHPLEEHTYALASTVVLVGLINFTFFIYPYSKAEATPPVDLAIKAKQIWNDDVIYYWEFNCDNWIFRYFNKRTTWRPITLADLKALREELLYLKGQGKKTWIDATAFDQVEQSTGLKNWFDREVSLPVSHGLTSRKHRIEFSLLVLNDNNDNNMVD